MNMKKTRSMNENIQQHLRCDICGYVFSTKSNLNRHKTTIKACMDNEIRMCPCGYKITNLYKYNKHIANCVIFDYEKKLKTKDYELEKTIEEKDNELEKTIEAKDEEIEELNNELKEKNVEIIALRNDLMQFKLHDADKGGQIKIYEKRPVVAANSKVTNHNNSTNYVNPKLVNVKCDTIRPFTVDTVREDVAKGAYTYDHFIEGIKGMAEFILSITTQDEQKSYVCTDAARNKFHRLIESRVWKDDNGATFLNNIFDEVRSPSAGFFYKNDKKIIDLCAVVPEEGEDDDRDFHDRLLQKIRPMYHAINDKNAKSRDEIINKIRNEVKKTAAV
jgi:hypothetical protein